MATKVMKTFTVGADTYEIVDEYARRKLEDVPDDLSEIMPTDVSQLNNDAGYVTDKVMKKYVSDAVVSLGGSASIVKLENKSGFTTKSVASGNSVSVAVKFTSVIVNDDGEEEATGDGSCQIIVNDVVKNTLKVSQGNNVIDISDCIGPGTNTVIIKVTDIYGVYKLLSYTISVIDLYITTSFDDTLVYSDAIQYKYIAYGAIEKTVHLLVDGEEIYTNTVATSGRQVTATIPKQIHGVHQIEVYMTATLNDEVLESNRLVSEAVCIVENDSTVLISSVYTTENVVQGEQISIPYIVYNPILLTAEIDLIVSCGGVEYSKKTITVGRTRQHWNVRDYPIGNVSFTIKCGNVEKTHTLTVAKNDVEIVPVTNDLELYLTSTGRLNNEDNPAKWEYGDITTTFENVNWDSTGWVTDENGDSVLRLNGGATATIGFKPFKDDLKIYGKTLEFEFAIRDVNNRDAKVILSWADKIGMQITADRATLNSQQTEIFCNYVEEERVRVSFVVESRSEYRLMQVYINGILSGVKQYPTSDNFQQSTPVNITIGSEYCGVDIYNIRSYSNALSFNEVINNYIADTPDLSEKLAIYEENNLYDEYGVLSYEKIKKKIPVMTIIGSLPQSKGDKKNVIVRFEHNTNSGLSFDDTASIDVQGTSSQWYVRKNYKIKTSEAHMHADGQMPTNVFCTKADYAESTSTHNTQNANLVETLYSEKTPAQEDDERCRTTIFGYPIVIFHQPTASDTPIFIGKYNFNFDKGSEEVFGFSDAYDVESWEFLNNTSDRCNFLASIGDKWDTDFEARYPDKYKDISRFKVMHDWVVSTKGNVNKFKAEFEDHFDLHFALIYYVYTSVMLMVDQRAKNMFLTYWAETGKWQPWFYDNDTCLGINNEGLLVFDYYHEDIDIVDEANVYNGQNSTLWVNFRQAYADEIKECYQTLRNDKKLTYEKIVEYFIENGSRKWPASIYNEDSDYKYISMLRSDNDATNLYQVRGNGEGHLKYFVSNRLKYLDSKWYASDYADNYATLRIYTPQTWEGVAPNYDITVTPFSNMYAGVRYKANGTLQQIRADKNVPVTFDAPNETFTDTETAIYGASEISSLGDLAPLYCGTVNVAKANRLTDLKIGDATEGYVNTNLKSLSVGTNKLLKTLDVRNCPNLVDPLALSGCPNIEEIYATGSGITGVELANSGYLRVMHLPATITDLTLKNQLYISDMTLEGYENISSLNIENCPSLDTVDLLNKTVNIQRVRITDVNWEFENAGFITNLINSGIGGIDESGYNTDKPQISGICHIEGLAEGEKEKINDELPYLTIVHDKVVMRVVFMSYDGSEVLDVQWGDIGGSVTYDGATPTKESTIQYNYTFAGWSSTKGGEAEEGILDNISENGVVYAAFTSTVRTYNVFFYNGTTMLQMVADVPYGSTAVYTGDTPKKLGVEVTTDYAFDGWSPSPISVTGDVKCYAQYKFIGIPLYKYIARTLSGEYTNETITIVGNRAFYWMHNLTSVKLPSVTTIGENAFDNCLNLETVVLHSGTMASLVNTYAFRGTKIAGGTGYIYVPSTLIDHYKAATNWSTYAAQFRAIEDYPDICGGEE